MRLETMVRQTVNDPDSINNQNRFYACWGWNVLSVQITDNKVVYDGNSHTVGSSEMFINDGIGFGSASSQTVTERITEHTNYATITYQRDMDAPNMDKLLTVQKKYDELCEKSWTEYSGKSKEEMDALFEQANKKRQGLIWFSLGRVIAIAVIALFFIAMFSDLSIISDTLVYLTIIPVLGVTGFFVVKYINLKRQENKEYAKWEKETDMARQELEKLQMIGEKELTSRKLEVLDEAKAILGIP